MKTLNYTKTILVLLFAAVIGIATTSAKTPEQKKDIRSVLKEAVQYPQFALQDGQEGSVDVLFKLADDGKLQIKKVESTDQKLKEYIRTQFANINPEGSQIDKFKTYKITISFRLK